MALKREITAKIKELLREKPQGLSITEIVRIININRNTAGRYLENLMVSGQVEMRHFGMAKIYRLAQRVPLSAMLSISSELIMLLDGSLRVIYANEPLLKFLETTQNDLYGKNIEYTPCVTVCDDAFDTLKKHIKNGLAGKEWSGELSLKNKEIVFSCRIAPTVFEEGQRGVSVLLENITEWKRSEQRIQESERQFRLLAENTLDMIDRHTPDGTCIYVSPACKTIFGYDSLELIGHTAFEVLHPDDVHIIAECQNKLTRKNPSARVTYRIRHKDGHYVWAESVIRAIFDDKTGEFVEIYGATRDISRRKKAEEALQESEDRYRKLVEISPDAVILHRDGKIMYMNPAALNLIGASHSDEIIGKNVLDFIQPDFRDAVRINIQKDLRGDRTPPIELHMLRVDGASVIVEGRGIRTLIDGNPAVQVAIRDITERKQAEQALRESEATARALINAPTDSILLLDSLGVILELNDTAARRLGKPKDELVGVRVDDILPEGIAQARRSFINRVIEKRTAIRFEDERDGIWYDTVAYPIMSETGEVNKIAIIARDITDRRRIEEALRESEGKLHAMLQSITDPMSMMDKDLNIIWVNETAKQYFGKDIVGRKCYEAFHQRRTPCEPYPCLALKAFRDGKMQRHETAVIDAHGQTRLFECTTNVALRDKGGKPVAVLEISRDITDRKRAEEALRER
jgi:PAS domain S-box-containing protein